MFERETRKPRLRAAAALPHAQPAIGLPTAPPPEQAMEQQEPGTCSPAHALRLRPVCGLRDWRSNQPDSRLRSS
jgi:hypothetical protein